MRRLGLPLALLVLVPAASSAGATLPTGTIGIVSGPDSRGIYLVSLPSGKTRRVQAPEPIFGFDLSPDGRHLAVAGSTGIWLLDRDGSHPRRIFVESRYENVAGDLAWSPDGRRLAFVRSVRIFTLALGGSGEHRVANDADAPDWWPDGKTLVFVRHPEQSSRNGALSSIGVDGTGLRRVVTGGEWGEPSVSPTGLTIAFQRNGFPGVYTAATHSGKPHRFLREGRDPEWSPDGRYLASLRDVRCDEAACDARVFVAPTAGGRARPYGPVLADPALLSWSR